MSVETRETTFAANEIYDAYLPTYSETIGQPPPIYRSNPSLLSPNTSQLAPPTYVSK